MKILPKRGRLLKKKGGGGGGGESEGISRSYFRYFGMGVAFTIFFKIMRKHPTIYQCVVKFKIFTWDFSGSKLMEKDFGFPLKINIHICYLNENTFQKRSSIKEGGGKSEGISGSYFRYFEMSVAFTIFVKILRKHPIYQCVLSNSRFHMGFQWFKVNEKRFFSVRLA